MAYIGVQPTDTYLSIASQQITGNGGATYTLDYSVSNEEDVAVFVNNVRQNVSTYSVSSTTLTLGGTISASDSCWVLFLGRTVGTKTPAVGSVTNDMLAGSIATSKLADGSTFATTNGITEADQWRLTTAFTNDAQPIASNLERNDTSFSYIGTGMTESSGVFTFPSTGIWLVKYNISAIIGGSGGEGKLNPLIEITTDGSSFSTGADGQESFYGLATNRGSTEINIMFDVTNTSTHKVRFTILVNNTSTQTNGSSTDNRTYFTFIRLGDT